MATRVLMMRVQQFAKSIRKGVLKRDMNKPMSTYDKLVQRKRHGEKLDMKQVTYGLLYQLWWNEDCTDATIAELFDVTRKKITNLRYKWGMKVPETIVNEFEKRFNGTIPTVEEDSQVKTISADATALLRKINELNDIELESLRVELARRFPSFSDVKQEIDFMQAAERAVRQFAAQP